jgi:hypothetical protein
MTQVGMGPVQKAFFETLSGDATLMSTVTEVTDCVRETFPYIYLGDNTEIPFRTFARNGHENTFTVHIYTQDEEDNRAGNKLGQDILEMVTTLLCAAPLSVDGHETVLCSLEFADTITGDDGITRDTIGRYRVITQDS